MRRIATAIIACLAAAAPTGAGTGLHIPGGRKVGFTWAINDGAGCRWDISANGQVSDGTNDAYDGGMQLRVNGSHFGGVSRGTLDKAGREVEIGPWKQGNLQVYRRVYVDPKEGYCRWVDLFENTTKQPVEAKAQYYSNMGGSVQQVYGSSGKASVGKKDWGVVTASSGSSRPAVVHVFASRGSRVRPTFRYTKNNDSVYMDMPLKIPPGKTVGLCIFHAQRRHDAEAREFLEEFKPRRELAKLPPELRRVLLNMGGATLILGDVNLPRHEKHDLAVLRNENELLGTILDERFDIETFYGRLDLPAGRVVGLHVPTPHDPHVQVVLADGQIVSGTLRSAPLAIRLTNGNEMSLPPKKLQAATFALSKARPDEIKITQATVVLRSGQQLAFDAGDLDGSFRTEYGAVALDTDDLAAIQLDTPDGGLHRVRFRNGSVLSGLLEAETLRLGLTLGPELAVRRHLVRQFVFPAGEPDDEALSELVLRNEDRLLGHVRDSVLTVATRYGDITVKPEEIAELRIHEEAPLGQVNIRLHNGTTVSGKAVGQTLRFAVAPGPELPVFLGHVVSLTCPPPPPEPEKPEKPGKPTTKPAGEDGSKSDSAEDEQTAADAKPRVGPTTAEVAEAEAERRAAAEARRRLGALNAELRALNALKTKLKAKLAEAKDDKARAAIEKKLADLTEQAATVEAKAARTRKNLPKQE